jgi:hypothetical protein
MGHIYRLSLPILTLVHFLNTSNGGVTTKGYTSERGRLEKGMPPTRSDVLGHLFMPDPNSPVTECGYMIQDKQPESRKRQITTGSWPSLFDNS